MKKKVICNVCKKVLVKIDKPEIKTEDIDLYKQMVECEDHKKTDIKVMDDV